jgi:DNA polymerase-3 subunit beta
MQLTVAQKVLSEAIALVSRAVPSRPSHPVLANVLFVAEAEDKNLTLTAFDLSIGIALKVEASVEVAGSATFPAKLLSDIISRAPEGELRIEVEGETVMTILAGSSKYTVRGMAADAYPEFPLCEGGVEMPVDVFRDGLRGVLFAVSSDETKQVLTGVHITVSPEEGEFAATDGHRLAVVQFLTQEGSTFPEFDVTVPGKALREVERMVLIHSEATVSVALNDSLMVFRGNNWVVSSRLIEAQYPNYPQLIPRRFTRTATCDRKSLIAALERIAVLADQKNSIISISFDPSEMLTTLSADAADVGSGREQLAMQFNGEALDIAFNVRYLLEGLKAMQSSEVQLSMNTATSPAIIVPLGSQKMIYLCMPVQIRS